MATRSPSTYAFVFMNSSQNKSGVAAATMSSLMNFLNGSTGSMMAGPVSASSTV